MKRSILIFTLLICVLLSAATKLNTKVSDVTVYMDRAVVTRSGSVTLQKGFFEGYISNVPANLDISSITVKIKGKKVKLYDISYTSVFHREVADEKVVRINKRIDELTLMVKKLSNRNQALQNQLSTLKSIKVKIENDASKAYSVSKLSVDNLSQGLSFILNKYTATLNAIEDNNITVKKHQTEMQELRRQLGKYTGPGKEEKRIVVSGYCKEAGKFKLSAKYLTYNASWYPTYKIYLEGSTNDVKMEYYGVVQQRTGEDWKGVGLTLSTSAPSYGLKAPIIQPYYLQNIVHRPQTVSKRSRKSSKSAPSMAREQLQIESAADAELEYYNAPATVVQNAYSVEYKADLRANIPTTGEAKTVYLHKQKITGDTIYKAVPRMDEKVYAQIKSKNNSLSPILAGKVSVFYGASFVGDYTIRQILPGEKFKLDLGPVNFFKTKFKLEKRKYAPPSGLNTKKRYEFVYKIIVENLNDKKYKFVLYDRIPVSRDAKIKIEKIDITPEGHKIEDGTSVIKWEIDFPAKTKKTFSIGYQIETPKDYNIGL